MTTPNDRVLKDLLASRPRIALVGASSKTWRPSHQVMEALLEQGYDVVPVHPRERSVLGIGAFPDLASVTGRVDLVDVFRRSEATPPIAHDTVRIGARALWLQIGVVNQEAARIATEAGLLVVMDRCTIVEHGRLIGRPHPVPGSDPIGLCRSCRHARQVETPRSTFWLCRLSASDPSFPRYPRLPVVSCRGYESVPDSPSSSSR